MTRSVQTLCWIAVTLALTFAFGWIALNRGETINALWLVVAAVCTYLIAYRFYSLYIAARAAGSIRRPTPAVRYNDGLDYVPTNKYVLFGHHFAAIAGAGPLVGPVLAAQMGYLPGTLWILVGVVFAGAVQDFIVLFISSRRDGRSLGDMIRTEMGPGGRRDRDDRRADDHDHPAGRAGAGGGQGAGRTARGAPSLCSPRFRSRC